MEYKKLIAIVRNYKDAYEETQKCSDMLLSCELSKKAAKLMKKNDDCRKALFECIKEE